jgi:hypothetical protein
MASRPRPHLSQLAVLGITHALGGFESSTSSLMLSAFRSPDYDGQRLSIFWPWKWWRDLSFNLYWIVLVTAIECTSPGFFVARMRVVWNYYAQWQRIKWREYAHGVNDPAIELRCEAEPVGIWSEAAQVLHKSGLPWHRFRDIWTTFHSSPNTQLHTPRHANCPLRTIIPSKIQPHQPTIKNRVANTHTNRKGYRLLSQYAIFSLTL